MESLLIISLCLGLPLSYGCGSGETHFVSDKPPARIPNKVLKPAALITESFAYGQSTGTPVVAFVVYPRKSLRPARASLVEQIPAYLDALLSGGEGYRGIHFAVMRDLQGTQPEWFSPNAEGLPRDAWKAASLTFLRESLSRLAIERDDSEIDSESPFQTFERVARDVPYRLKGEPGSVWLAFNYFRDGDWTVPPLKEEGVRGTLKSLNHSLALQPISPFRTSLELIAYLSAGGDCDPLPSRVAYSLLAWFESAGLSLGRQELCPWFSSNPGHTRDAMARAGAALHRQDRRLILQSVPKLDGLEVHVAGAPVLHENVMYLSATNEISFRQGTLPMPAFGDVIQVRYESN